MRARCSPRCRIDDGPPSAAQPARATIRPQRPPRSPMAAAATQRAPRSAPRRCRRTTRITWSSPSQGRARRDRRARRRARARARFLPRRRTRPAAASLAIGRARPASARRAARDRPTASHAGSARSSQPRIRAGCARHGTRSCAARGGPRLERAARPDRARPGGGARRPAGARHARPRRAVRLPGRAALLELAVRRREAHAAGAARAGLGATRIPAAVLSAFATSTVRPPERASWCARCARRPGTRRSASSSRPATRPTSAPRCIDARGWTPAGSRELVVRWRGEAQVPERGSRARLTGGSPTALEQLAGWLARGDSPADVPSLLVDVVSVRVNRLDVVARRVLQAVAVHGTVAPRWMVETCSRRTSSLRSRSSVDRPPGRRRRDPDHPVRAGRARGVGVHAGRRTAPPALARARGAGGATGAIGVLAHHAEQAGEIARAFDLPRCGHDAVRRFDDPGAAVWYGRAVAMARELHARGIPRRRATGRCVAPARRGAAAERRAEPGARRPRRGGAVPPRRPPARARADRTRGLIDLRTGDPPAAVRLLQAAAGRALRAGNRDLLCQNLPRPRPLTRSGRAGRPGDHRARAGDRRGHCRLWPDRRGRSGRLWRIGVRPGRAPGERRSPRPGPRLASQVVDLARKTGAGCGAARSLAFQATVSEMMGDHATARHERARAIRGAPRAGGPEERSRARAHRGRRGRREAVAE